MDGAAVGYEPGKPVLRRLGLRIDEDDRIGLLGANGNGKSTLSKLIAGRLQAESGEVRRSSKLKIGFFAQHQIEDLSPDRSALAHMRDVRPHDPEQRLRTRLDSFGLDAKRVDTPAGELSGGEKSRLALCLMAQSEPHMLILDEPTNHLDIDSREALVQSLNDFPGAVILVSHDAHLVEAVADRLWLVDGGTVTAFDGDMSDYRRKALGDAAEERKSRKGTEAAPTESKSDRKEARKAAADARKRLVPYRKAVKAAEQEMEKISAMLARVEVRLRDPEIYAGPQEEVARLTRAKADGERALANAEAAWMMAEEALEQAQQEADAA